MFLAGSVILAGLLIAGAVIWNGQHPAQTGSAPAGGTGSAPTVAVNVKDVSTAGEPFVGDPNAPVTLVEWSDYQCPFCKEWEVSTLPDLMQQYVSAGKVKIVFKDFAFLGPDSMTGAEWARAVWQLYPSQYFAWRSAIFTDQQQENSLSAAQYLAWIKKTTATVSGIDTSKIEAAVASNQSTYDAAINADKTEAAKFGISATPSFVVGTQMIAGAYPTATFTAAIDQELGK